MPSLGWDSVRANHSDPELVPGPEPLFSGISLSSGVHWRRVAEAVARLSSHRTGLVLFTSGSSGRRVMTPDAGRVTTS